MIESRYHGQYARYVPPVILPEVGLKMLDNEYFLHPFEAKNISITASKIWKEDVWAWYCLKVVAAISFEHLISQRFMGDVRVEPSFFRIMNATHAYSKAAKKERVRLENRLILK